MLERRIFPDDSHSPTRLLVLPLWILAIYAIGYLASEASTTCLWIVCSFFLFVLIDPVAERLKKRGWPTALAAALLIILATALIVGASYLFGSLFAGMVVELQQSKKVLLKTAHALMNSWNAWLAKIPGLPQPNSPSADDVSKVEVVSSSPMGGALGDKILQGLGSFATVLTFALLVPILSFFILAERDGLGHVLTKAYREPGSAHATWRGIVKATRAFFVGNLLLGVITFPLFVLLFWAFGVPSVFTVAALATVFNLVPFAGAVLSGLLPGLTLYAQTQALGGPLALYGFCIVTHFVIADFVTPKLLGAQVNINATTSTIALVAWGELWGGVGLILAIPLTALIKILFEHSNYFWLQWIAGLMSEDMDTALKVPTLRKIPKEAKSPGSATTS
jgi:predicted PurR-regulated permease PerM